MATYLVTGANRGIGLGLCTQLAAESHTIYATCRSVSQELQDLNVNVISNFDITDQQSVNNLDASLGNTKIDVLINNAGIWTNDSLDNFDTAPMLKTINVNALAPLYLTSQLLHRVSENGKIIFITSRMGSIGDNDSGGRYGYRMSKAALNAGAKSLAVDVSTSKQMVALIHPGHVQTSMGGTSAALTITEAAKGILQRVDELTMETSGTFWHQNGTVLPW